MSLYLKYRPQKFTEMIGNESTLATLDKMLSNKDTCPHAFLLTGPTGCGKTTAGRIIANELGCIGNDFTEIDSADFRGIDTVRDIRKRAYLSPLESPCRIYLIDECHKMTNDAQNALLKILEDTPKHVYFILATTDPHKLLKTIHGRCSSFTFNPLWESDMKILLRRVTKKEGERLDKEVYDIIIDSAQGHPRNALQILEQVLSSDEQDRVKVAKKVKVTEDESIALCRALLKRMPWKVVSEILKNLKQQGEDPETIRRIMLGYTQSVLLNNANSQAALILELFIEPFYDSGFPGLVYACYASVKS